MPFASNVETMLFGNHDIQHTVARMRVAQTNVLRSLHCSYCGLTLSKHRRLHQTWITVGALSISLTQLTAYIDTPIENPQVHHFKPQQRQRKTPIKTKPCNPIIPTPTIAPFSITPGEMPSRPMTISLPVNLLGMIAATFQHHSGVHSRCTHSQTSLYANLHIPSLENARDRRGDSSDLHEIPSCTTIFTSICPQQARYFGLSP